MWGGAENNMGLRDDEIDMLGDAFGDAIMEAMTELDDMHLPDDFDPDKWDGDVKSSPSSPASPPVVKGKEGLPLPTSPASHTAGHGAKEKAAVPIHDFTFKHGSVEITSQIIEMQDSYFIYVGLSSSPRMDNLVLSIDVPSHSESKVPLATSILAGGAVEFAEKFAVLLGRRTKKAVYLSYNLNPDDKEVEVATLTKVTEQFRELGL